MAQNRTVPYSGQLRPIPWDLQNVLAKLYAEGTGRLASAPCRCGGVVSSVLLTRHMLVGLCCASLGKL